MRRPVGTRCMHTALPTRPHPVRCRAVPARMPTRRLTRGCGCRHSRHRRGASSTARPPVAVGLPPRPRERNPRHIAGRASRRRPRRSWRRWRQRTVDPPGSYRPLCWCGTVAVPPANPLRWRRRNRCLFPRFSRSHAPCRSATHRSPPRPRPSHDPHPRRCKRRLSDCAARPCPQLQHCRCHGTDAYHRAPGMSYGMRWLGEHQRRTACTICMHYMHALLCTRLPPALADCCRCAVGQGDAVIRPCYCR